MAVLMESGWGGGLMMHSGRAYLSYQLSWIFSKQPLIAFVFRRCITCLYPPCKLPVRKLLFKDCASCWKGCYHLKLMTPYLKSEMSLSLKVQLFIKFFGIVSWLVSSILFQFSFMVPKVMKCCAQWIPLSSFRIIKVLSIFFKSSFTSQ